MWEAGYNIIFKQDFTMNWIRYKVVLIKTTLYFKINVGHRFIIFWGKKFQKTVKHYSIRGTAGAAHVLKPGKTSIMAAVAAAFYFSGFVGLTTYGAPE